MKVQQIEIDKKKLIILDDMLEYQQIYHLYEHARKAKYGRLNSDLVFDVIGAKYPKWRCDLTTENVQEIPLGFIIDKVFNEFFKGKNIQITNAYINYSSFDDVDRIHVDWLNSDTEEVSWTILVYGNHDWHPDWAGETKFYSSDKKEIKYSNMIKPGRVVLFEGLIPHSATAPSRLAEYFRYTYAIKLLVKDQ